MSYLEIYSIIIFLSVILVFLIRKLGKNVEFKYGIFFLRYKKIDKRIENFIFEHEKLFGILSTIIIVAGFLMMGFTTYYIFKCAILAESCFAIVLPAPSGYTIPGPVITIPFYVWLFLLPILIIPHEFLHAIFSIYSKLKIKSYGLIFLLSLPIGAFVDPDMKKFRKISLKNRLAILSAGSFANFLIFLIFLLILLFLNQLVYPAGLSFVANENTPAKTANMEGILVKINNTPIYTIYDLANFLNKTKPNDVVLIETTKGKYVVELAKHPNENISHGYLGINITKVEFKNKLTNEYVGTMFFSVGRILLIFLSISLGIALANMLPLKPLDGGLIVEEILSKFIKSREKVSSISNTISIIILSILLYNLYLTAQYGFPFKL